MREKLYDDAVQVVEEVCAPVKLTVAPVSQPPVRLNVVSADVYGLTGEVIVGALGEMVSRFQRCEADVETLLAESV